VVALDVTAEGLIANLYLVTNPDKLSGQPNADGLGQSPE
jgi:hypothetical protein